MKSKSCPAFALPTLVFVILMFPARWGAGQDSTKTVLPDFDRAWDFTNPVRTEAYFRSLLPGAEAAGDADYHAQLLTQIARAQGIQGDREGRRRTLEEVRSMLRPETKVARIRYHLEFGRLLSRERDQDGARAHYLKAWALGTAEGADEFADEYAIDAAHMLGLTEKPKAALAWNLKALELARSTPDPRARNWTGPLYNNLGWLHYRNSLYPKALEWFDRANIWFTERRMTRDAWGVRWSRGITLRKLKRFEDALAVQKQLEKEWNETDEIDARVLEEIGACLLALGRREESQPYYARAYTEYISRYRMSNGERRRIEIFRILGGIESDGVSPMDSDD